MPSGKNIYHSDGENDAPVKHQNFKNKTNLYVKNFGNEMTEKKLYKLFDMYGTITSCIVSVF